VPSSVTSIMISFLPVLSPPQGETFVSILY
jgi:hypothetical protein